MNEKKIRFAIIGAGFIAHYHARAVQEQRHTSTVAICDTNFDKARKFAGKYKIPEVYQSHTELLQKCKFDAVILCLPNVLHVPLALEFIAAGKDVFIEKPLGVNVAEGEKLKAAKREKNRRVMIGHMWRFDSQARFVHDMVSAGKIGKIIKTKGYGIHVDWGPEGWFTQKLLAGGGALADMGVHAIDTVRFLLSDPQPVSVYAILKTCFGKYDVDDMGMLMIEWDSGTISLIESGWWHPFADGPEASTQLIGTKGYARLFPTSVEIPLEHHGDRQITRLAEKEEHCDQAMYSVQMAHFVHCLRNDLTPLPGIEEGIVVQRIVEAAYRSAESGEVVRL